METKSDAWGEGLNGLTFSRHTSGREVMIFSRILVRRQVEFPLVRSSRLSVVFPSEFLRRTRTINYAVGGYCGQVPIFLFCFPNGFLSNPVMKNLLFFGL